MSKRSASARKVLDASEADLFDDPIFHVAELTLPDEVIGGNRPNDTSVRHDFYLYGVDLDEIPELHSTVSQATGLQILPRLK
jgi:hypothetical protein